MVIRTDEGMVDLCVDDGGDGDPCISIETSARRKTVRGNYVWDLDIVYLGVEEAKELAKQLTAFCDKYGKEQRDGIQDTTGKI